MQCQTRLDWFTPSGGVLADLKTCDSLNRFEYDCLKYGYVLQMAYKRAVLSEAGGRKYHAYLVAVEKNPPYATGVWMIETETMAEAELYVRATLKEYKTCLTDDVWPTRYEQTRLLCEKIGRAPIYRENDGKSVEN